MVLLQQLYIAFHLIGKRGLKGPLYILIYAEVSEKVFCWP